MAANWFRNSIFMCVMLMILASDGASVDVDYSIPLDEILKMMTQEFNGKNSRNAFENERYPVSLYSENPGRTTMQSFLKFKFSSILGRAGGKEFGHILYDEPYTTTIRIGRKDTQVTGINYIAVLAQKENKTYEDRPLVLLANYDTDATEENPTEENGSGVAALLVIGSKLADQIQSGRLHLKHSIILAATDTSLNKYARADGNPVNSSTGADFLANRFLPEYLVNRPKGLRGVIVLDSLMNYQHTARSQINVDGMDRSYPEAYAEMAKTNYSGNFVALVARGDELDRQLVDAIVENWEETRMKNKTSESLVAPRLIKFIHEVNRGQGEGYLHFLESDQTSFWNHKSETVPPYPAILLTDTRDLRAPVCRGCDYFQATTATKNLEFVQRSIQTVYKTTINLQASAPGLVSTFLTIPLVLFSLSHYFWV